MAASIKKISVIIPTRNRAVSLVALLDSLAVAQRPEGAAVEIIVVDNGSTDDTAAALQKQMVDEKRYPLRVLSQPEPGKSNALNLALASCDGDMLMVFDDDVTVEPRCLVELVDAYRDREFAAMQGRILPGKDPDGRGADVGRLREYNIPSIDYGDEIHEIRGLTGTNMSFKREILNAIGCFDVRLGPGAAGFSEDTEFSLRIRKAGFKIGYTPHAVVYHELNPNRYGRAYNRDVEYRKGMSRSLYRRDSMAFNIVPNLLANFLRLALYRSLGKRQKAYKTEGRLFKCLGYIAGKLGRRPGAGKDSLSALAVSESPAISVVIATFNRAKYLPATIDSVLDQSFKDFELIVVDDGSTDNTREVLERYGSRLKYLYQPNGGASAARNLGVRHARGAWIAFQDSDDLSVPNHLASLYGYATKHPACGMVFANGNYLTGTAQSRGKKTIIESAKSRELAEKGVRLVDLFEKSILRLQAALISRQAYDLVGGHDESLRICMDLDLGLRMLMNFPVAYLDEELFSYRIHDGNIGRNEELRLTENIQVIEKLIGDYPAARQLIGKNLLAHRLAYRYYRLAKGRWKRGEKDQCREALREAIRLRPFYPKYRVYQLTWG